MKSKFTITLIIASLFVATTAIRAQTKPAKPQTFAILYEPGPNWIKGEPFSKQDLMEHAQYMQKLLDNSKLMLGGPFTDNSGGMAIITVDNSDAAEDVMKNDPAVVKGVFTAKVRPWYVVFQASK
jgi:uncharacterized protein YciI